MVMKTMAGINLQELPQKDTHLVGGHGVRPLQARVRPMPNLYFTAIRSMIGNGVSINRMYSVTRNRETIYGDYIFKNHPDFAGHAEYYSRNDTFHIEGGDILNINEHVLAIGISAHRARRHRRHRSQHLQRRDEPRPSTPSWRSTSRSLRAFMHLDTVFTQIDYDKFTIHPGIMGPLTVFEITPDGKGGTKIRERNEDLSPCSPSTSAKRHAHPLRRRRPHRGRARAVERRLPTRCASARHRGGLSAQQRHQRRAVQAGHQLPGDALRRALPRPWRPALHVHAGLARGSVSRKRPSVERPYVRLSH